MGFQFLRESIFCVVKIHSKVTCHLTYQNTEKIYASLHHNIMESECRYLTQIISCQWLIHSFNGHLIEIQQRNGYILYGYAVTNSHYFFCSVRDFIIITNEINA